jgi:hypothetical protein
MTQSALHLSHHTYSTQFACMMATHNEGNPEPQTASSMRNHGAAINQSSKCITTLHGTLDQPLSADGRQVPIPQGSTACTCQPLLWGGGIVTRRHVRSQQKWHCLPRWEPTVKDRC